MKSLLKVLITSIVLLILSSCDLGLSQESKSLTQANQLSMGSRSISPATQVGGENLTDGQVIFSITLPSGQAYVELFARKWVVNENRWLQNVAVNITGSGQDNGDNSTTYTFIQSGYADGDLIQFRFYHYSPASPGLFTPGPDFNSWLDLTYYDAVTVQVVLDEETAADAQITGYNPNDRNYSTYLNKNYGAYTYMSVGAYDNNTVMRVLFKANLPEEVSGKNILSAKLIFKTKMWVDKWVADNAVLSVHQVLRDWEEGIGYGTTNSLTYSGVTSSERFWGEQDGEEDWNIPLVGLDNIDASSEPVDVLSKFSGDMTNWEFDITDLVVEWNNDPSSNKGVIFKEAQEYDTTYPDFPTWWSSEAPNYEDKPVLEITYK